jgi:hypothetical protein
MASWRCVRFVGVRVLVALFLALATFFAVSHFDSALHDEGAPHQRAAHAAVPSPSTATATTHTESARTAHASTTQAYANPQAAQVRERQRAMPVNVLRESDMLEHYELQNRFLKLRLRRAAGPSGATLAWESVHNLIHESSEHAAWAPLPELFLVNSGEHRAGSLHTFEVANSTECALAQLEHNPPSTLTASFFCGDGGHLRVEWSLELAPSDPYVRWTTRFLSNSHPLVPHFLVTLRMPSDSVLPQGDVQGSPLVVDNAHLFAAVEHPLSANGILRDDRHVAVCGMITLPTVEMGEWSTAYRTVIGAYAEKRQARRAFNAYLNTVRASKPRPFLHYNSWFDFFSWQERNASYSDRKMDEQSCTDRVRSIGTELVRNRHVRIDSFLWDDGWDNHSSLWSFHAGFPEGFTPVKQQAAKFGAGIGVWLSPWGGYGPAKDMRLQNARAEGYETNKEGFSLSGKKYFQRFKEITLSMVRDFHVNLFKFDGISFGSESMPALYAGEVESMLRLLQQLREEAESDLWINLTTGMWPSPFWLLHGDSIWRGFYDLGIHAGGPIRQQWVSFRDAVVFKFIVSRARFFPLHALMLHGIVAGAVGESRHMQLDLLHEDHEEDFKDEVWTYFAMGVQLQELYVSPDRMTRAAWDVVGEAAAWARRSSEVLLDSHWIGGNPVELEAYGYASWSPERAFFTLRNPRHDARQRVRLSLDTIFQLPRAHQRGDFSLHILHRNRHIKVLELVMQMGTTHSVCTSLEEETCVIAWDAILEYDLHPLAVVVFEATPIA